MPLAAFVSPSVCAGPAQVYNGGEPCDVTGKPRETEVRLVCSEDGKEMVASLRESATCRYTLVFTTPRLCSHPAFHTPEPPMHQARSPSLALLRPCR
jgi:hypothetical protein